MQIKEHFDIIIIGAGASGLYAAHELTKVKVGVLILEGSERIGGRMYTNLPENFSAPIESGAEFVHGEAPITLELLKKANAEYIEMKGNTFQVHDDEVEKREIFDSDWQTLIDELRKLKYDMPFAQFLSTHFGDAKYDELRANAKKFVEGYNAADLDKVSAMALSEEWSKDKDPAQYRIKGGYEMLYGYLKWKIEQAGGVIKLNHKVTEIAWKKGNVEVKTIHGIYQCRKCLITIPVSVLETDAVKFIPAVPQIITAAANIGFGAVVKINLEFKKAFWETETPRKFKDLQFLFTEEVIPTWWSQVPDTRPLLTGWIGGPGAARLNKTDEQIFESAITSLANAMKFPAEKIKQLLLARKVDQWVYNEFCIGAYSYEMVGSAKAVEVLQQPIDYTLYFSGEAIYSGPHKGTVEAALTSGANAATRMLSV
jgi:monoamine oxidase